MSEFAKLAALLKLSAPAWRRNTLLVKDLSYPSAAYHYVTKNGKRLAQMTMKGRGTNINDVASDRSIPGAGRKLIGDVARLQGELGSGFQTSEPATKVFNRLGAKPPFELTTNPDNTIKPWSFQGNETMTTHAPGNENAFVLKSKLAPQKPLNYVEAKDRNFDIDRPHDVQSLVKKTAMTELYKLASNIKTLCKDCGKKTCVCEKKEHSIYVGGKSPTYIMDHEKGAQVRKLAEMIKKVEGPQAIDSKMTEGKYLPVREKKAFSISPGVMQTGARFAKGALPGMAVGALTADPGEGLSGALKGGLMSGGLSLGHSTLMANKTNPIATRYQAGVKGLQQVPEQIQNAINSMPAGNKTAELQKLAIAMAAAAKPSFGALRRQVYTRGNMGTGALVGAGIGALTGAVTADPGEGMSGALKGGLAGGALGAGVGYGHSKGMMSQAPLAQEYQGLINGKRYDFGLPLDPGPRYGGYAPKTAAYYGVTEALEKFAIDAKAWMAGMKGLAGADRMKYITQGLNHPETVSALKAADPTGRGFKGLQAMVESHKTLGQSGVRGTAQGVGGVGGPVAATREPPKGVVPMGQFSLSDADVPAPAPALPAKAPPLRDPKAWTQAPVEKQRLGGPDLIPSDAPAPVAAGPKPQFGLADLKNAYQKAGIKPGITSATNPNLHKQASLESIRAKIAEVLGGAIFAPPTDAVLGPTDTAQKPKGPATNLNAPGVC